jgi:hypothetical protein
MAGQPHHQPFNRAQLLLSYHPHGGPLSSLPCTASCMARSSLMTTSSPSRMPATSCPTIAVGPAVTSTEAGIMPAVLVPLVCSSLVPSRVPGSSSPVQAGEGMWAQGPCLQPSSPLSNPSLPSLGTQDVDTVQRFLNPFFSMHFFVLFLGSQVGILHNKVCQGLVEKKSLLP